MATDFLRRDINVGQEAVVVEVPLQVMGISMLYAAALSRLERRYPIKPDHIWAEVAGGVAISLLPIALEARRRRALDWQIYEKALWLSFFASGTPIILWQLGEAMLRQRELIHYMGSQDRRSAGDYADDTTPLALRGGGRAGERDHGGTRGDSELTPGPEHA
jgi:hypothetical protein